jgi:hypothetical protein
MEETAEEVASMHCVLLLLANDRQPAGLIWGGSGTGAVP